jgi:chromosomal replication initiation ATPase DnaA
MQDDTLWHAILGEVELSITRGSYVTWFKNTRVLRAEDNKIVIGVANIFTKQQLETKYKPLLDELLEKYAHPGMILEFKIHATAAHSKDNLKKI